MSMRAIRYVSINSALTLLRLLPFPSRTGLIEIGRPGRHSPVLLTGNFRLTLERVKQALRGIDAYLLVANSNGMNVWCAATGGHLTNHDVISVLKTSGVEERVDHRRVILPQLAATGIEGRVIERKTGWSVTWGPVRASDIHSFLENDSKKNDRMRTVDFPWTQRLEMAVAWAFPISLTAAILLALPWPSGILPLTGLIWGLSLAIFLSLPFFRSFRRRPKRRFPLSLLEQHPPLFAWLAFLIGFAGYSALAGDLAWPGILRWGIASLAVTCVVSIDLKGSTPVFKSSMHGGRFRITLDSAKCDGVGLCALVCPTDVFVVSENGAAMPGSNRCVQCGGCIVQCPRDALCFRSRQGEQVTPDTVRRFKLNLLGDRLVPTALGASRFPSQPDAEPAKRD